MMIPVGFGLFLLWNSGGSNKRHGGKKTNS